MNNSSISVLIPAYSNNKTLLRLLQSLKKQSISKKLEIIVSDDCSPKTLGLSKEFYNIRKILKIRWYRQSKNLGILGNLIFLSKKAKNKYVVFAQHDDYYFDNLFFERSLNILLNHPNVAIIFANSTFEHSNKNYFNYSSAAPRHLSGIEFSKIFLRKIITSWSCVVFDLSELSKFGGFGSKSYCLSINESHKYNAYNQEEGMAFVYLIALTKDIYIDSESVCVRGLPLTRFSLVSNTSRHFLNDCLLFIYVKVITILIKRGVRGSLIARNIFNTLLLRVGLRHYNVNIFKFSLENNFFLGFIFFFVTYRLLFLKNTFKKFIFIILRRVRLNG